MSKKHFIELANLMRGQKPIPGSVRTDYADGRLAQWEADILGMADFCASQNSSFKRDRWLAYIAGECGPNGGIKTQKTLLANAG